MAYTDYLDDVQKIYIAYYQRPADPAGLIYWAARLDGVGGNLNEIIEAFANSAESLALYGPINSSNIGTVVDSIYNALFDRVPDAAGKAFYVDGFNAGTFTAATIMLNILNGSTGLDLLAVDNKLAAAERFTEIIDPALDGRDFQATYVGDPDAIKGREYLDGVTWNPVTVPTVIEATDFIKNNIADPGDPLYTVLIGQTFMLTTGVDDVRVTTSATTDIVKGYWEDTPGTDTFSTGDSIQGNGKTILELVVDGTTWGDSPYVEMSKVDKLSVLFAKSGGFTMDASTYGTDISTITLSGKDNSNLYVYDLSATGQLDLSIAPASDSYIYASGSIDGFRISASLSNDDTDSVGAIASIGATKMSADLGRDDYAWLAYYQTTSDDAAVVSVGDMAIGAIDMNLGKNASADFTISNWAYNSGTGTATAGSITVGDVSMVIGTSATAELYIYNSATANSGAATVGNITVGNIDVQVAAYGSQSYLSIYNSAYAWKGNATAGNITLGNINVSAADDAYYGLYMDVYNYAYAYTAGGVGGNAKVGNITVGDIDIVAGNDNSYATLYLSNYAYAQKGKATTGNITVGDVNMAMGNEGYSINLTIYNDAHASAGAATVGNITVGNVDMTVGSDTSGYFYVSNYAYSGKGAATVGAVTIGDFKGYAGLSGSLYYTLYNYANGTAGDSVGNTTIGNINMYGEPSASLDVYIEAYADTGSVGNVTIGNVDMKVDNDGEIDFSLDVWAAKNVGDVKIGDVNLTLGSGASLDTFSISVTASAGDIASFTIGNVTITGGKGAYDDSQGLYVYAGDDIGNITIGDVKVTAGAAASFTSMAWDFIANGGNIGNISMGNTTMTAAAGAYNYRYVNFTADNEIGNVTAGNISLSASGTNASAWLEHNYNASDDIGNFVYGNISAVASGKNAYAGYSLEAYANGNTIGTVTFGDVNLQAKNTAAGTAAAAYAGLYLNGGGDTVGLATVGNINLYAENVKAGTANAYVNFETYSNGSISVGNITLTAGAGAADWAATAIVDADVTLETGNNLTVGNVTVVGGSTNTAKVVLDTFGTLSNWLHLTETGSGSITIGNVDYSGYKAAATIDVSAYKGAGTIWASQGGTTITDNKTQNTFYLGAGKDEVIMNKGMTTDKSDPTKIDAIVNFTSGSDKVSIDTDGGTDFAFVSSAAANYAAFLSAANSAMFNLGTDIYARQVGGDMYVAFDKDFGGAVDFVIQLTGISSVVASDFNIT